MTVKTKKLAVEPISPDALAAGGRIPPGGGGGPTIPTNWRDAFADLAERLMKVIGKQAGDIKALRDDLSDARSTIAAASRGTTDQIIQLAATIKSDQAEHIRRFDEALQGIREGAESDIADLAGRVAAVETDVKTESGAVRLIVKAIDDQLLTIADRFDRSVIDIVERVQTVEGVTAAAIKGQETFTDVVDALAKRIDTAEGAVALASDAVNIAKSTLDMITGEASTRADAIADILKIVEAYAETASGEDGSLNAALDEVRKAAGALGERVEDIHGRVGTLTKARADDVERAGAVETRVEELQRIAMDGVDALSAVARDVGGVAARVGVVEDAGTGFTAAVEALGSEVKRIDTVARETVATVETVGLQSQDAVRRVTVALGELPAGMMINREGQLVRVNRAGDMVEMGNVVSHGADGKDAPVIIAAKIEDNRFIMTMSDRSEISCLVAGLTPRAVEPAPTDIDPTKLGYFSKDATIRAAQVEDMVKMRAGGTTFAKIAEKYNISARQAARLIKDFDK